MDELILIAILIGGYYAGKKIFGNSKAAGWIGVGLAILVLAGLFASSLFLIEVVLFIIFTSLIIRWTRNYFAVSKEIRAWRRAKYPETSPYKISSDLTEAIYESDDAEPDIPYNRVSAFNDNNDILTENDGVIPIYYDAKPADNEMAFREFGILITTKGVLYKKQVEDPETKDSKAKSYIAETTVLPFSNAYKVTFDEENDVLTVYYADRHTKQLSECGNGKLLYNAFSTAINNGWTRNVDRVLKKTWAAQKESLKDIDKVIKKAEKSAKIQEANRLNTKSAILSSSHINTLNQQFKTQQLNARFGASQGHGVAAEQANWVSDYFKGFNPSAEGHSNVKSGADRIRQISGEMIQTKYYASARSGVNNFLKKGYVNGNGKLMTLEVPKDQYKEAIGIMRKKIELGQVPNETNPKNAANYVKKGALTYRQSKVATLSIFDRDSTIKIQGKEVQVPFAEKLVVSAGTDFLTGAAAAAPMSVVNFVWIYANNRWQGVDRTTATKNAMIGFAKPMLIGGLMYTVASQFAGSELAMKTAAKFGIEKASRDVIAKRTMGALTVVVAVGPDAVNCLVGKISFQQLVKNTAVTGAGMAVGGALGTVIPVPVVGTLAGSMLGGFVAKKVLDHFSEDDSVIMARIAKQEFIEVVMFMPLTKEEFNDIAQTVFDPKEAPKLFKLMFQNGGRDREGIEKSRKYIDETLENLVVSKFKARESFDDEIIEAVRDEFGNFEMAAN